VSHLLFGYLTLGVQKITILGLRLGNRVMVGFGLGNSVKIMVSIIRVMVGVGVGSGLVLGLFVKAPSSD